MIFVMSIWWNGGSTDLQRRTKTFVENMPEKTQIAGLVGEDGGSH